MERHGIQANGNAEHSRTSDKDPVCKALGAFKIERRVKSRTQSLTDTECGAENLAPNAAKHQASSIVDAIYLGVAALESTDNVVGPGGDGGDGDHAEESGDQPQRVKGSGYGEDS